MAAEKNEPSSVSQGENMSDVNKYTEQALERYVQMENPQFAALISGEWGTGKTWFIKNFFATHKLTKKFCYISLFDIKSIEEIDTALIEQISCSISSKGIRIISKITRYVIERHTGYDIDEIEKIGDKISKLIPNGVIICLDDIERSELPLQTIFGYISNLLEQFESNVILICDTKNIENKKIYHTFSEKIIGLRLTVKPNINSFINYSISKIYNKEVYDILCDSKEIIYEYFYYYRLNNIRYIRMSIYYFIAIYDSTKHKDNTNYLKSALISICDALFSVYSPRENSDRINRTNRLHDISFKDNILKKYNIYAPVLDKINLDFWNDFFEKGIPNLNILEDDYDNSPYNAGNKDTPLKLSNYYSQDDSHVINLYKKMISELESYEYKSANIFLYAVSVIIEMLSIGVEKRKIDFSYFKKIIDNTDFILSSTANNTSRTKRYTHNKNEIFIKVKSYLFERIDEASIKKNTDIFYSIIKNGENVFYNYKLLMDKKNNINLSSINSEMAARDLIYNNNSHLHDISEILKDILTNYIDDNKAVNWMNSFLSSLKAEADKIHKERPISYNTTIDLINFIERLIENKGK